jgi:hypothetical protein
MARPALLLVILVGCGHANTDSRPPEPAPVALREVEEVAPAAEQAAPEKTAQVITFDGDDAEPEPATMVRSAPPRPKIPAFQLFGTRTGDGPR